MASAGRLLTAGWARCFCAISVVVFGVALMAWAQTDENEPIKVLLGQSQLVDTPWAVTRVAVTDPSIVNVQVLTPRQLLLQGVGAGETDVLLWSSDDEVQASRVEVEIDVVRLRQELQALFPQTTLQVDPFRDMVVVKGILSRAEQIAQLNDFLTAQNFNYMDMTTLGGVQQVLLQVRVAEVSRSAIRALGVNFFDGGEDFFGGVSVGTSGGGALNPVSVGPPEDSSILGNLAFSFINDVGISPSVTLWGGFPDKNFQFFIQALAENQYLRVLAEPTLVALSGEEASFLAGGEFPIPIAQDVSGGGSSITVEYREFGVRLQFRPTVLGDGTIQLYVAPEVSELSDTGAVIISGFRIPGVSTRRAETTLQLKNGQTFAMAGLISRSSSAVTSRVPGLGDVPILGALFSSKRHTAGETELVVLVTASLVEPLDVMPSWPGVGHVDPNDWELYGLGQIEGDASQVPVVAPEYLELLQEMGLDRLRGPGAWQRYPQHAVGSRATAAPRGVITADFSQGAGVQDEITR